MSGESDEQQREIAHRTRHRPDGPKNCKRPIAGSQMTSRGYPARCGFQRAYTGKVGRLAYGATTVAAQTSGGKAGGDSCGFAATRSPRGPLQVPGICVRP